MPDFPSMETLFGDPIPPPEGFKYKDEFITPSEEKEFICQIASLPLAPYQYGEYEAKRRVYTFGPSRKARWATRSPPGSRASADALPSLQVKAIPRQSSR